MVMQHLAAGQATYPIGDAVAQTRLYTTRRTSRRRTLGEDAGMSSASSLTPGEVGDGIASSPVAVRVSPRANGLPVTRHHSCRRDLRTAKDDETRLAWRLRACRGVLRSAPFLLREELLA